MPPEKKSGKFPIFLETICIKNGKARHIRYHDLRLNRTRKELYGATDTLRIADFLPEVSPRGVWRARVLYTLYIEKIEIIPYESRDIKRLKMVEADIDYHYKYADRSVFARLIKDEGAEADDLILLRNGMVTDTTKANIAVLRNGRWITPAAPLLRGTVRQRLLDEGVLSEGDIFAEEIMKPGGVALMNAMMGFRPLREWSIF